ncbi:MAG: helix-turn-helix transcriptional regulator [Bacillota bacterium]|nr:helix-turn-helix transcriptional regulator [Bacillota bacterium]
MIVQIRELRNNKNISIQKLSEETGLHRRTLQDIEKRDDCLVSNAIKIAKALDVTLEELCEEQTLPR